MSVNKVILVGRLGKDPELRYTPSGASVCTFSLATDLTYRDQAGNKQSKTEWHTIVLWRGLADIAGKYLRKGKQVYIEGRIQTRVYEDRDGNRRYMTEIIGEQMQMLGSRDDGQRQPYGNSEQLPPEPPQPGDYRGGHPAGDQFNNDAEIPF